MTAKMSRIAKRTYAVSAALAALILSGLPLLVAPSVFAVGGQVTSRSIEMSNATPGAGSVTYNVTFTPVTSETHPDLMVDFCSNNPLIGSSCTATAGTDVPNFSAAAASGWTVTTIGTNRGVILTTSTVSFTGGTPVTVTITGVTNPSNTATFYGRILDYATGGATGHTSDSPGVSYVDYGGTALSTSTVIGITAYVMESLTFCVSGSTITTCGTTTTPSFTIGHTVGSNTILDNTATDVHADYTQTSTNAQHGVIVRMKDTSSTACGGLSSDGGTTCGIAANGTSAATIPAGTAAKFGMCVNPGSANTAAQAPYNDATCATINGSTKYGLDDTSGTSVISTYGSPIFQSTGGINQENDTLNFAATAALTTPAGIYTGNYSLIATGTF